MSMPPETCILESNATHALRQKGYHRGTNRIGRSVCRTYEASRLRCGARRTCRGFLQLHRQLVASIGHAGKLVGEGFSARQQRTYLLPGLRNHEDVGRSLWSDESEGRAWRERRWRR